MRLEWLGTCEPEQQHVCMQLDVLSTTSEVFFILFFYFIFLMVYQYYVHVVKHCKLVTCMVVTTLLTKL